MTDKRTPVQLAATVAHVLRPAWALPAVEGYLRSRYSHESAERLVVAVALAALDPRAETPRALELGGARFWLPIGPDQGVPLPPPYRPEPIDAVPPPANLRELIAAAAAADRPAASTEGVAR